MVAGQNSRDVVNSNSVNSLLPGISMGTTLAADYPPARVRTANATIEQPFADGSVFRVTYVFTHGENLDQNYQYNNAPSTYVWETATGTTPPRDPRRDEPQDRRMRRADRSPPAWRAL